MRMRLWLSAAILMPGAMTASLPANADPNWAGAGYCETLSAEGIVVLLSGPYSSEDECKSHSTGAAPMCTYHAADPTPDDK